MRVFITYVASYFCFLAFVSLSYLEARAANPFSVPPNGQRGWGSNENLNSDCFANCLCRKVNQLFYGYITSFQCLLSVFEISAQLKSLSSYEVNI